MIVIYPSHWNNLRLFRRKKLFGKEVSNLALQLFRLANESFPTISGKTSQAANVYIHTVSAGGISVAANSTRTLTASTWVDKNGSAVASFATAQGLTLLFSNGVLQQPALYSVGANSVKLIASATAIPKIVSGTPLVLQTYNVNATITMSPLTTSTRIAIP